MKILGKSQKELIELNLEETELLLSALTGCRDDFMFKTVIADVSPDLVTVSLVSVLGIDDWDEGDAPVFYNVNEWPWEEDNPTADELLEKLEPATDDREYTTVHLTGLTWTQAITLLRARGYALDVHRTQSSKLNIDVLTDFMRSLFA